MPLCRSLALPLAAALVVACGEGAEHGVPGELRGALDRDYPGWRLGRLDGWLTEQLPPGENGQWMRGDFDGDGRQDYAVQVVRPGGGRTPQLVLLYLRRGTALRPRVVVELPRTQGTFILRIPGGTTGEDVEADTSVFYPVDAVAVNHGQEASTSHILTDTGFVEVLTGD
ncbi:MAG: hypothetical protein KY467_06010 [Gemmatimonadetes bacterium]|nr:hypothetical protein [Gemmatimonadota bacterium]